MFIDLFFSSRFYQRFFASVLNRLKDKGPLSPLFALQKTTLSHISNKAQELGGDVLEIGAGAGSSLEFLRLPKGSSLVVVDYNPYFEGYFRSRLSKYPDIKLKDYFVQSAADMSNIPDNTFSVVFVIDVLCSIDEDLLRKMLEEVKRVLKPVCFVSSYSS